jgi:NAD(P)H-dependent FMN reductase
MSRIAILTDSIRPGRQSLNVARWVKEEADARGSAEYEIVDIAEFSLPVWNKATPPAMRGYEKEITQRWSATIDQYDGFIFIVSEYSHSIPGALKNTLAYLSTEFRNKAAGFVSYGPAGGARTVRHLRGVLSEMQVAHVRHSVAMSLFTDFGNDGDFAPTELSLRNLHRMFDQLLPQTRTMEDLREQTGQKVSA